MHGADPGQIPDRLEEGAAEIGAEAGQDLPSSAGEIREQLPDSATELFDGDPPADVTLRDVLQDTPLATLFEPEGS